MNTSALVIMLSTITLVTGLMVYFFYRVVTAKPKSEPDSYADNDDEVHRQETNL